jgi:hypothetical protein
LRRAELAARPAAKKRHLLRGTRGKCHGALYLKHIDKSSHLTNKKITNVKMDEQTSKRQAKKQKKMDQKAQQKKDKESEELSEVADKIMNIPPTIFDTEEDKEYFLALQPEDQKYIMSMIRASVKADTMLDYAMARAKYHNEILERSLYIANQSNLTMS